MTEQEPTTTQAPEVTSDASDIPEPLSVDHPSAFENLATFHRRHPELLFVDAMILITGLYAVLKYFTQFPPDGPSPLLAGGAAGLFNYIRYMFKRKYHQQEKMNDKRQETYFTDFEG